VVSFGQGGDSMDFDIAPGFSGSMSGDDGIQADPSVRNLRPRAEWSGPEGRVGTTWSNGPVTAHAPAPGPPPVHTTGRWQPWAEAHLYFRTGVGNLDDRARDSVRDLA